MQTDKGNYLETKKYLENNVSSIYHKMEKEKIKNKKYECIDCGYSTNINTNIQKHVLTVKHLKNIECKEFNTVVISNMEKFKCKYCCRSYKQRSGLWKHMQKCEKNTDDVCNVVVTQSSEISTKQISSEMILEFIRQNNDLKQMLIEQTNTMIEQNNKIIELSRNSHTVNNTNNNQFNLNIFLNEKCKDAVNLVDFVDKLHISLDDLENVGDQGYVNGITQIFMNGLKQLDLYTRPVHCTDIKRETLYVRDNNEWIKEDPEMERIKAAIRRIAFKNAQQISKWNELHPQMQILDTDEYNMAFNIMQQSLGGPAGTDVNKKIEKIVKNISQNVYVDKQTLI